MSAHYSRSMVAILMDELKYFSGTGRVVDALAQNLAAPQTKELPGINYSYLDIDIIPEIEKAAIGQAGLAAEKQLGLQLYLPPAPVIVHTDPLFLQPIFSKLFAGLFHYAKQGSAIKIHASGNDGQCILECINQGKMVSRQGDDYFRRHRITNPLHSTVEKTADILAVYKQVASDMNGKLSYAFTKNNENYFRLKLPLAGQ